VLDTNVYINNTSFNLEIVIQTETSAHEAAYNSMSDHLKISNFANFIKHWRI